MAVFTHILIFILIWWILFFILLPLKIRIPNKVEIGHARSAPSKHTATTAAVTSCNAAVRTTTTCSVLVVIPAIALLLLLCRVELSI